MDRERRRFQLHALLREQVHAIESKRNGLKKSLWRRLCALLGSGGLDRLRERHAAALERFFKDWETHWRGCRECLEEIIPTVKFLAGRGESRREWQLAFQGYELGRRVGELETALSIMQQEARAAEGHDAKAKSRLQACYGNQANILRAWGKLEEALELNKKAEAICLELGYKDSLQRGYGAQANILHEWGRLEEAMALHKNEDAICQELGDKDSLQRSYGNQALILEK